MRDTFILPKPILLKEISLCHTLSYTKNLDLN
jgi:hypothetical protein